MKKTAIAMMIASISMFTALNAQANAYVGLGVAQVNFEVSSFGLSVDLGNTSVGSLILGYELHPNFAVEAMASTSFSDAEKSFGDAKLSTTINSALGLYGVGKYQFENTGFEVFAKLGMTRADLKLKASDSEDSISETDSGSDISGGIGANYHVSDSIMLRAEYMNYYNKDSIKITGFGAGVFVKF